MADEPRRTKDHEPRSGGGPGDALRRSPDLAAAVFHTSPAATIRSSGERYPDLLCGALHNSFPVFPSNAFMAPSPPA
mgnify:CR=1 FL=1